MSEKTRSRHAGLDLLRIVSMVMIVLMHAIGHGGLGHTVSSISVYYHIYWTIYALCRVSTNCFVMLTGYYMVNSRIRASRVLRLWFEVLFYKLITFAIACKAGYAQLSLQGIIKLFTPISSGAYWFATGYVLLYLCVPLLNRAISTIKSQSEYLRILAVMLVLTSVLPTVFYWADPMYINGGYSFVWFVVLYFVAAYIRLYGIKLSTRALLLVYLLLAATVSTTRMLADHVQAKLGATTLVDNVMDYKMPITLLMSIAVFELFRRAELNGRSARKLIFALAPLSFGVYLLHDSDSIRALIWDTLDVTRFGEHPLSLLYMLAVTLVIVLVGWCVGAIYKLIRRILHLDACERLFDRAFKTE